MPPEASCDYVIVGSGAGGGTLAARLAEAGMSVVLLEAGGDAHQAGGVRLPADYEVPAFHPFASENPAMSWNFFVRHYADEAQQRRDPKYVTDKGGIFYPRAATLGGCTAHNAMILVRPHDADWEEIAALTGDGSWRASRMQNYFRRLENCHHRPLWRWLSQSGLNPTGHGWGGWLQTERALPRSALNDRQLLDAIVRSVKALGTKPTHVANLLGISPFASALIRLGLKLVVPSLVVDVLEFLWDSSLVDKVWSLSGLVDMVRWSVDDRGDPNDGRWESGAGGLCYMPLATRDHRRNGTRERLLDVAARHPDRLRIELHALATRVIFDQANRARGVEYLKGERLYRAHPAPNQDPGERQEVRAAREVILAGGAFNTPQLLMLSGVGPRDTLARHGIPSRVALEGVGRNLQDRYEVGVVNRMAADWTALGGAQFDSNDPLYREWSRDQEGMYTSNGTVLAVARRSTAAQPVPDLFCMALLARFAGYFPGYSREIAGHRNYLSWAVLKAYTNNRAGEVTLRSVDPRDTPAINFRYFGEGSDEEGADLHAVVEAIRFVRSLTGPLKERNLIAEEEQPGEHLQSSDNLKDFVRDHAWGHHASCTCAIGRREMNGVLDSSFRVHGTQGLRVVDASVFPRIPGFFIASAVYMIGEKAADVILADAARAQRSKEEPPCRRS